MVELFSSSYSGCLAEQMRGWVLGTTVVIVFCFFIELFLEDVFDFGLHEDLKTLESIAHGSKAWIVTSLRFTEAFSASPQNSLDEEDTSNEG